MSFLEAYDALSSEGKTAVDLAQSQALLVGNWLGTQPAALFAELRENRPIFRSSANKAAGCVPSQFPTNNACDCA